MCSIVFSISMTIAAISYGRSKTLKNNLHSNFAVSYISNSLVIAPGSDPRLVPGEHRIECSIYACPYPGGGVEASWTVTPDMLSPGFLEINVRVTWKDLNVTRYSTSKFSRSAL